MSESVEIALRRRRRRNQELTIPWSRDLSRFPTQRESASQLPYRAERTEALTATETEHAHAQELFTALHARTSHLYEARHNLLAPLTLTPTTTATATTTTTTSSATLPAPVRAHFDALRTRINAEEERAVRGGTRDVVTAWKRTRIQKANAGERRAIWTDASRAYEGSALVALGEQGSFFPPFPCADESADLLISRHAPRAQDCSLSYSSKTPSLPKQTCFQTCRLRLESDRTRVPNSLDALSLCRKPCCLSSIPPHVHLNKKVWVHTRPSASAARDLKRTLICTHTRSKEPGSPPPHDCSSSSGHSAQLEGGV